MNIVWRNANGLSLIELIVGLGLMSMICLGGFYFFNSSVSAGDSITMMEDLPLSFYSLSRLLTADVRSASTITRLGQQLRLQTATLPTRQIRYYQNQQQLVRNDGIEKPISDNPQMIAQFNNRFTYQNGVCTLTNVSFGLPNGETKIMPTIRVNTLPLRVYIADLDPSHPQPF